MKVIALDLLITTKLKVTFPQAFVVAVEPENVTVPPFALKVGEPLIVSAPVMFIFPDGAVNVPPLIVNPLTVALAGMFSKPLFNVVAPEVVKVVALLRSIVEATVNALRDRAEKPEMFPVPVKLKVVPPVV